MSKNITVAIIGSFDLYKSLAKTATESDITMGNHFSQNGIFTYIYPKTYPDKISSLIQSVALADTIVFEVKEINQQLGEQIVALDSFENKRGFIIGKYMIEDFIKGTQLENWKEVEADKIREELFNLDEINNEGPSKVTIDHFFPVKGVGTVALGLVNRGKITAHQKLMAEPNGKEVEIRSIQVQDKDTKEAQVNSRVGLAVKNITPEELTRGTILCEKDSIKKAKEFTLDFTKSNFYKPEIKEGEMLQFFFNIRPLSGKVKSVNPFSFELEKEAVFEENQNIIVTKFDAKGLRVLGNGKIV